MFKFLFNLILLFNLFIYTNFCFSKTISVVTEAWYPYVYQNEKNEPAGIDYVKCKKIFDSLGIELKIEFLPWLRALDAVKKNEADGIIDIIKNPEREEFAIFSKQQLSKIELAVFYKKNKPFQYKNLDSFSGKKVAIMRGYGYPKNFQDAKNFTKVDITGPTGSERNFKKLI